MGTLDSSSLGAFGGVGAAMEMIVDAAAVGQVIRVLEDSIGEVRSRPVAPVPASVFGGSAAAGELGHHTGLAHDVVVEALEDVLVGLRVYQDNVDLYLKDVLGTDEAVETAVAPLRVAADCIDTERLADLAQCPAPDAGGAR